MSDSKIEQAAVLRIRRLIRRQIQRENDAIAPHIKGSSVRSSCAICAQYIAKMDAYHTILAALKGKRK